MSAFVGTRELIGVALRRDRIMLPAWVAVFVLVAASSAAATADLYPTVSSRAQAAAAINGTPSLVALYGKVYAPTSLGAVALIKLIAFGAALVGVLGILTVVRHTRAEEESGRLELIGATAVGRHAALAAALAVTCAACLTLGALAAVALYAAGLPAGGTLAFGAAWAACGIAFAAVAAVAAQLTTSPRAAVAISCAALGASYLARAVGDSAGTPGARWLSWASPIGWSQQVRPFAGDRWPATLLSLAFAIAMTALASRLAARRDLGAGLIPDRPGPATAGRSLHGSLGLAWHLQRASLLAWTAGFILLGAVCGNIASNVGTLLNGAQATAMIRRLGGQQGLTNAFLSAELGIMALIASAYGVQAVLRLRSEEAAGRAEPLLATTLSRTRWLGSHLAIALAGSTVMLGAAGAAAGLTNGAHTGRIGRETLRLLAAALVRLPAVWLLIALTAAALCLSSRLTVIGWVALAACVLLGELGALLRLDHWVLDVSPFAHVPELPGGTVPITGLATLTLVVMCLVVGSVIALRRRDIG